MGKIYIPDGIDGVCYVPNNDYITILKTNSNNTYNQGYRVFKSDYQVIPITQYGQQNCDTFNEYTHDISYRNDLSNIFIMLFIFITFIISMFKLLILPWLGIRRT